MREPAEQPVYRLRKTRRANAPKRYRGTYQISDDDTKHVLATCDVMGHIAFATHEIFDDRQAVWRMAPNRSIMPSRWLVTDPAGRLALQFHQQILRKILNPLRRTGLALLDADGHETARLLDSRTGIFHRMLGPGEDDWILARGNAPIAKLTRLPTPEPTGGGLLKRIGRLLTQSDRGLVSLGPRHVLSAPAALALFMLVAELTNPSGVE